MAFTLLAVPQLLQAQHHQHPAPKKQTSVEGHADNPARALIAARAELKLTDEQVKKLEAIVLRMDAHHKSMRVNHGDAAKHESAKHEAAKAEDQIHKDFFAIFTKEQLPKVKEVMAAHHAGPHSKH